MEKPPESETTTAESSTQIQFSTSRLPLAPSFAEARAADDDALVGFLAGVDPLAVDVDGLRQRVGLGGVGLLADDAGRHGERMAFLEEDAALDGAPVVAEGAGEVGVQLRRLLGLRHQLGGPRLPLPHRWCCC